MNYTNYFKNSIHILHCYKLRLISSSQNKLFYNIFKPGVIPFSPDLEIINNNKILIKKNFSFLIKPNNRFAKNGIKEDFLSLPEIKQNIIEKQLLKCDIIKDFTIDITNEGYLCAEYNYLEFENLFVNFYILNENELSENHVILTKIIKENNEYKLNNNYIEQSSLNSNILYNMNVDKLLYYNIEEDKYEALDVLDYNNYLKDKHYIPLNNYVMQSGLNVEFINGYKSNELGKKYNFNNDLNAEYLSDINGNLFKIGNEHNRIPLSNLNLNVNLNANFLNSYESKDFANITHQHNLNEIVDGVNFAKVLNVEDNLLTNNSFENKAFTREKIDNECFFSTNFSKGGPLLIITGKAKITNNYTTISFTDNSLVSDQIFDSPPLILLQLIDEENFYNIGYYIKLMAYDISSTTFKIAYEIYYANNNQQYQKQNTTPINIFWAAFGYSSKKLFLK